MRLRTLAVAVAAVVVLAACGDDGPAAVDAESSPGHEDLGSKPTFEIPSDEAPPSDLQVEVLAPGDGPEVAAGQTLVLHYVGRSWSDGEQFDASWDRGSPFSFTLGERRVIPGWELGIGGDEHAGIPPMRVGERRQLVIPPELAYGPSGAPPAIGPDETLVFVVDLIGVEGS